MIGALPGAHHGLMPQLVFPTLYVNISFGRVALPWSFPQPLKPDATPPHFGQPMLQPWLNHRHDPYGHDPAASSVAPVRDGGSLMYPCPAAAATKDARQTRCIGGEVEGGLSGIERVQ